MVEKILIVDDDLDTLKLVGLLLQRKGFDILVADNAALGIEKALTETPDLILLDTMMPDVDGIEMLKRLKSYQETTNIPVILFTARSQVEDKVNGFEAGADDYLIKPTHPAELVARIRSLLSRTGKSLPVEKAGPPARARGRVTAFIGSKGGLGVTTTAVNVGIALQARFDMVLVEMRPGIGGAALMLKLHNTDALSHFLQKNPEEITANDLEEAIVLHQSGLSVLPASYKPIDARYATAGKQMATIAEQLAQQYEQVLIDLGPGLSPASIRTIEKCNHAFVLAEPIATSLLQTKAVIHDLRMNVPGLRSIQVIILSLSKLEEPLSLHRIQTDLGLELAAVIPSAPELFYRCLVDGTPVTIRQPVGILSQQYVKIAEVIAA